MPSSGNACRNVGTSPSVFSMSLYVAVASGDGGGGDPLLGERLQEAGHEAERLLDVLIRRLRLRRRLGARGGHREQGCGDGGQGRENFHVMVPPRPGRAAAWNNLYRS